MTIRKRMTWPDAHDRYLLELRRTGTPVKECVALLNARFGTERSFTSVANQVRCQPTLRELLQMAAADRRA